MDSHESKDRGQIPPMRPVRDPEGYAAHVRITRYERVSRSVIFLLGIAAAGVVGYNDLPWWYLLPVAVLVLAVDWLIGRNVKKRYGQR
ncbi:hypothetical protein GCM10012275_54240 [Longimycelium tulufanense]|uniref:Uncharacterized protein n=1 Tax=Longimycelium tulufanense TaxID=907463 RepID=A0A8J3CKG7_9PSEU|nr:hypothetical protein GCM10012275_54240 [Longimycelium tulufanense]